MKGDTRALASWKSISAVLSSCSGFGHVNLHETWCNRKQAYCICTSTDTCKEISSASLTSHSPHKEICFTLPSKQILYITVLLMMYWYSEV